MNFKKTSALYAVVLAITVPTLFAEARVFAQFEIPLQPPWRNADIGDVGLAGSASETRDGDLIVNGAGSDIWGTADSFHFVYQPMDDGEISANRPSQDATNPFAKVGIMIRRSLDPGSPHVILDVKPDGGIEFMTRSTPGGDTTFVAGGNFNGQASQMRLIRGAGVVTAVVCRFVNGTGIVCQTLGTVPFPSGMALAGAAVTSHDPTTLNHGMFPASPPSVSTVPLPWRHGDVGDVGLAGSAFSEDGTFTVQGAGGDIWGTQDAFQLVANSLTGDGFLVARVTSEQAANSFAKAGILMSGASPSGPSSAKVILDVRPNGDVEFMARPTDGAPMTFVAGSTATFPVWLKLKRTGNSITGFTSSDGRDWQAVGTAATSLPTNFGIVDGLAVTSHDTAALNTSTFDHVLVATSVAYGHDDIGDVGIAGEFQISNSGLFTLQGGGGDIWGAADAFTYVYQSLMDDGQMAVRVDSLDDTDRFAKAGIMIRESLDPSSAFVMVNVTPSSLVEVLTRPTSGAEAQWVGGLSPTSFPIWLKLTRSGNQYDAYASHDNVTWQHLTQAFPNIPADAVIGLAVTSHARGTLTTATFEQASR
jgi:regulation of enolase protein 1 (concanavalin A-like superfamily)